MKLQNIYEQDIDRYINPVATVGDLKEDHVNIEINEYVFTQKLLEHLYTFLDSLINKTDGKNGVWINGYYGSGKSHFLKYIYYTLQESCREKAMNRFRENVQSFDDPLELEQKGITPASVKKLDKALERVEMDTIMFNIDTVSKDRDEDNKITRLLYNQFNKFRGYNGTDLTIADFERQLDGAGKFDEFKKEIDNELNKDWTNDQDAADLIGYQLDQVLEIATELVPSLDKEATRASLLKEPETSIEEFVAALNRFLEDKPDDYRLTFLVDEVSQYIGSNGKLLLNLQTIIEDISDYCNNKVWLVCTAQQELGQLKEAADPIDDFGKIMGRVETRLSLESLSADYITKKRVLEKNGEGTEKLESYFHDNQTAITNQFEFESQLYDGFLDSEEFIQVYPFIPYQFKLISEVIRSFNKQGLAQEGYRNSERAIIGIIHYTAKQCKEDEVGYVVPFDAFYNNSFQDMLTHQARGIIENALRLDDIRDNDFAKRVAKALFLISYLSKEQSLQFKANKENLALAMMDEVDQPKLQLQTDIEDVLRTLEENSIVSEEEGSYRFLGDEEIIVKKEIRNTAITQNDRLEWFQNEILEKTLSLKRRYNYEGSKINLFAQLEERHIYTSGDINVNFIVFGEIEPNQFALNQSAQDLSFYLHDVFTKQDLKNFKFCVKVRSFVKQHFDSATGSKREAMETFSKQVNKMLDDLRYRFKERFDEGLAIVGQQVESLSDYGSTPSTIYDNVLKQHVKNVYKKRELAVNYASSNKQIEREAKDDQTIVDEPLTPAENEVYSIVSEGLSVEDVVGKFQEAPYGWSNTEIVHVLLKLNTKNKIRFKNHNEETGRIDFAAKALRKPERPALTLHKAESHDPGYLQKVVKAINSEIFNEQLVQSTPDHRVLRREINDTLDEKIKHFDSLSGEWVGYPFQKYFKQFAEDLRSLKNTRQDKKFFDATVEKAEEWGSLHDTCIELEDFIETNRKRYQDIRDYVEEHRANFGDLNPADKAKADTLKEFLQSDEPHQQMVSANKAYKALGESLEKELEKQREETKQVYKQTVDALEEQKVAEGATEYEAPDWEQLEAEMENTQTISQLKNKKYEADAFHNRELEKLHETLERKPVEVPVKRGVTIKDEEDMTSYLDKLKEDIEEALEDDSTVILK